MIPDINLFSLIWRLTPRPFKHFCRSAQTNITSGENNDF